MNAFVSIRNRRGLIEWYAQRLGTHRRSTWLCQFQIVPAKTKIFLFRIQFNHQPFSLLSYQFSYLVLSALILSSHSIDPQNGDRIMFFRSRFGVNCDHSFSCTKCDCRSFRALKIQVTCSLLYMPQ